ncbi:hypothetical protein [Leptospira andrefontaineae]|uniref:Uncharacterized protein n=1 Tax=Leptospira andrefontaineae TaxID=2484976 RepID=A0A4R9GYP9_9LEPT|nr:hypothetical protein [Leptospira andrefontaineae]TGK36230.1 hypothetical protein EHO65_18160 [Leptospira andrefontaineae]
MSTATAQQPVQLSFWRSVQVLLMVGILVLLKKVLQWRNRNNIEIPVKLKRRKGHALIIPKGYVWPLNGKMYVTVTDYLAKPNNKFQYIIVRPAPFWYYVKGTFRIVRFKVKQGLRNLKFWKHGNHKNPAPVKG